MLDKDTKAILPEDINFSDAEWYTGLVEKYEKYRFNLLRVILGAASLTPVLYLVIDIVEDAARFFLNYAIPFVILLAMLVALWVTRKTDLLSKITLAVAVGGFVFTLYEPNAGNVSLVIFYCFAPIAFQLSGTRRGVWWIALFAAAAVSVFVLSNVGIVPPFSRRFPSLVNVILAFVATVLVSLITYFSERRHEREINYMIRSILFDEATKLPNKKALLHSITRNTDHLLSIVRIEICAVPGLLSGPDLSGKMLSYLTDQLRTSKERFNYTVFTLEGNNFGVLSSLDRFDKEEAYRKLAGIRYYLQSTFREWRNTDLRLNIFVGGVMFNVSGPDRAAEMLSKAETALNTSIYENIGVTLLEVV